MKFFPIEIENTIFYFLSHPIADLLRGKFIILENEYGYAEVYNFSSKLEKGLVRSKDRQIPFQLLWNIGIRIRNSNNEYPKLRKKFIVEYRERYNLPFKELF